MNRVLLLLSFFCVSLAQAQTIDVEGAWPAKWIAPKDISGKEFGVYKFRKTLELSSVPDSLIAFVSGDNRYRLYVNGAWVSFGPATGDLNNWHYEKLNLSPYLTKGRNLIAAVVWNYGSMPPDAQSSVRTGFLLCAQDDKHRLINTDSTWLSLIDDSYGQLKPDKAELSGYFGAGSFERVDSKRHPYGWETPAYDDKNWQRSAEVGKAWHKKYIWANPWKLTERTIPLETITTEKTFQVPVLENATESKPFLKGGTITIPKNTKARVILQMEKLTSAYPEFTFSKGMGADIKIKYVEAGYVKNGVKKDKGDRAVIKGKDIKGVHDQFIANGGGRQIYQPLWWRAYRFIELTIETKDEALQLLDFTSHFVTYPFKQQLFFELSPKPKIELDRIIEVGERTLRLCSHETFMDCPYYEQSQFVGDTRVQALISYTYFGDSTLGKNAINQFAASVNGEKFISARYPTNSTYFIPNFNIYWVGMLHDYMMYFGNEEFIKSHLATARFITSYFTENLKADYSMGKLDYHQFVDWTLSNGEAPRDKQGFSAMTDLHTLLLLQYMVDLEDYAGDQVMKNQYSNLIQQIKPAIVKHYWNKERALFSDTKAQTSFSQHTNILSILTGVKENEEAKKLMKNLLSDTSLTATTIYWNFYKNEALHKAGVGQQYLNELNFYQELLDLNVTTWPETGKYSRSECHAWSSSPNYHLSKIIGGMEPASPGFKTMNIKPALSEGQKVNITFPHPMGIVKVSLQNKKGQLIGDVQFPKGLQGTLRWNAKEIPLNKIQNLISVK